MAKSAPDGYNIVTVIAAHAANATLYQGKLPFDPVQSFIPFSLAGHRAAHPDGEQQLPARDVKELIAYAKANPGQAQLRLSGIGAAAHLTTELFKQTAGIDMVHVPFKGTAPALLALQANDIQILVDVPSTLMPHVRGGKIKALAMFSKNRIQGAQEVPTMAEAGGPPLESSTWVMFLAPAGTPRDDHRPRCRRKRTRRSMIRRSRPGSARSASSRWAGRPSRPRNSSPTRSPSGRKSSPPPA